ncbi:hypothetical protein LOB12_09110 [Lactobacillus delbrueckii subsp. lactis]|nr:hypothetical protein [Lactobacillus delbrueckii subsp. lactis]
MTAFTGVDSQNLPDVMVSVQFILAIGVYNYFNNRENSRKSKAIKQIRLIFTL